MMNFLPIIYEDELLYSVISRYKQMCGMISKTALTKDLFNKNMILMSVSFPQRLNVLVSNFPPNSKLSVDEVILNHTMFPFYTAFLSDEKTDEVYRYMAEGYGGSIENIIGLAGSKVKQNDYLQYCPICFRLDKELLGESYWRRTHQIPGVLYCDKHQVLLKYSKVLCTDSRVDYCCADDDACDEEIVCDLYSPKLKEMNVKYVQYATYLLKENRKRQDLSFIIRFYIDRLRVRGFASKRGSLYMQEFLNAFNNYFPSQYLELMKSSIEVDKPTNWLRLFVRNNGKNRSPLRHILLLQFLGIHVDTMFSTETTVGKAPTAMRHSPSFDLAPRRQRWLNIIEQNPGATRAELKKLGKGLHTWIYIHDREWYEQVTPRISTRRKRSVTVDWDKRDEECLILAKQAVQRILSYTGKPVRVIPATIRREIGVKGWFDNKKLVKTQEFMKEVTEDIGDYRVRKIRWAIRELQKKGENVTAYKVQLYAGFGGKNDEMKNLVKKVLGILDEEIMKPYSERMK